MSNHSANVFRVLDNFHFAKLLTVCGHPVQELMTTVAAILNPTALPMIGIEPIHPVHTTKAGDGAVINVRKNEAADAKSSA